MTVDKKATYMIATFYVRSKSDLCCGAAIVENECLSLIIYCFNGSCSWFAYFSGIPGEIAYHGWLFPWTWLLAATLSLIIVGNLFIPIFYKMRLTSVYEVRYFRIIFINCRVCGQKNPGFRGKS